MNCSLLDLNFKECTLLAFVCRVWVWVYAFVHFPNPAFFAYDAQSFGIIIEAYNGIYALFFIA